MDNVVRIHFRGICTHLVNGSPHEGTPKDIGLLPIHRREPHEPLQHRVLLPWSLDLPEHLKARIPQHYPRLRYHTGDLAPHEERVSKRLSDDLWELDMTGVAVWFRGVDETRQTIPPASALATLPSVWMKTPASHQKPMPDPEAINSFHPEKFAACVDFFGGQDLQVLRETVSGNREVLATLQIKGKPRLVWAPGGYHATIVEIRPGATLEISNTANEVAPCCEVDYLLNYNATLLDLFEKDLPEWAPDPKPIDPEVPGTPGPDGAFCGNSTYP